MTDNMTHLRLVGASNFVSFFVIFDIATRVDFPSQPDYLLVYTFLTKSYDRCLFPTESSTSAFSVQFM